LFCIGRVLRATGLAGEIRIQLFRPRRSPVQKGSGRLELAHADGSRTAHTVLRARWLDPTTAAIAIEGIRDRDSAEALAGAFVWIDPKNLPAHLGDAADRLLGARVVEDESGRDVGEVTAIDDNGAQAMLAIDAAGAERLVPFVEAFIAVEELEGGPRVRVRAIPGLLDDEGA
jgi:16S rRNA processing protein RimM